MTEKAKRHILPFLFCSAFLFLFSSTAYALSGPGYQNGEIITSLEVTYSWNLSSVYRRVWSITGKIDNSIVFDLTNPDLQGSYSFIIPDSLTGKLTIKTEGVNKAGTRTGGTSIYNVINCPHSRIIPQLENGIVEYLECSVCGKQYFDIVHHTAQAPTCTSIGWNAYDTCTSCGYSSYIEIPALGHDFEHHNAKTETCTEFGWNEYDTCQREGCNYTTYIEVPALGHELEKHESQAPTCTIKGWDEYYTCARCSYTTYKEMAALGHDWDIVYSWSKDNQFITANCICLNDSSHTDTETAKVIFSILSPTESTEGFITYKSSFIKEMFEEQTKTFSIPALNDMNVIQLPLALTVVEDHAFENLACEAIIIPDNCISIGSHAFCNCQDLIYLRVPARTKISHDAFEKCEKVIIDRIPN